MANLRELLAAYAHKSWSRWMQYMLGLAQVQSDGSFVIPEWAVDRWSRQAETDYYDLPEDEKDLDRRDADEILKVLHTSSGKDYMWYVIRHRWYTFVECCRLGIPLLGLLHDRSKLWPSEFGAYAQHFYGVDKRHLNGAQMPSLTRDLKFDTAWNHHQKRNKHHWQYWLLIQDEGGSIPIPIPSKYRREMLADWRGAGHAILGDEYSSISASIWYLENKDKITLHSETRAWIELQLEVSDG